MQRHWRLQVWRFEVGLDRNCRLSWVVRTGIPARESIPRNTCHMCSSSTMHNKFNWVQSVSACFELKYIHGANYASFNSVHCRVRNRDGNPTLSKDLSIAPCSTFFFSFDASTISNHRISKLLEVSGKIIWIFAHPLSGRTWSTAAVELILNSFTASPLLGRPTMVLVHRLSVETPDRGYKMLLRLTLWSFLSFLTRECAVIRTQKRPDLLLARTCCSSLTMSIASGSEIWSKITYVWQTSPEESVDVLSVVSFGIQDTSQPETAIDVVFAMGIEVHFVNMTRITSSISKDATSPSTPENWMRWINHQLSGSVPCSYQEIGPHDHMVSGTILSCNDLGLEDGFIRLFDFTLVLGFLAFLLIYDTLLWFVQLGRWKHLLKFFEVHFYFRLDHLCSS